MGVGTVGIFTDIRSQLAMEARLAEAQEQLQERRRNDAIKHVREAAEIALTRIGGEEAEKAIKVTTILTSEMTNLRGGQS